MRHALRYTSSLLLCAVMGCSSTADVDPDDMVKPERDQAPDTTLDMASDSPVDDQGMIIDQGMVDQARDTPRDAAGDVPVDNQDLGQDAGMDMIADMVVVPSTGLCANVTGQGGRPSLPGTNPGAMSPFGTGNSSNVTLGAIEDPNGPPQAVRQGGVELDFDLTVQTYDVHVPDTYDGSEPYGLVVFINSGNNGTTPNNNYIPQFESDRLIQVAPDGAGNSINIDDRMGLGLLGAARAMEIFNIDPSRVYAMGNSGGARSSHMLAYQYPELFTGAMPRCGANYPRTVDQDYETQEPDGNYEFWGDYYFPMVNGMSYIDYLRSRQMRFALMTSFRDFREGDVFNIYHNGMQQDGLYSRLIQGSGGHCATSAAHFADAMGWVEHPLHQVAQDSFDATDLADIWLTVAGDAAPDNGALALTAPAGSMSADVVLSSRVRWHDSHGVVLRATLDLSGSPQGTSRIALWPFDTTRHVAGTFDPPTSLDDAQGGVISVSVERTDDTAHVIVEVARQGEAVAEIFRAQLEDWSPQDGAIELRMDAWESELQIDLGWHLQEPTNVEGAALLNDRRTIRTRWDALFPLGWGQTNWDQGSVMTLSVEGGANETTLRVDAISVHDAAGFTCDP